MFEEKLFYEKEEEIRSLKNDYENKSLIMKDKMNNTIKNINKLKD